MSEGTYTAAMLVVAQVFEVIAAADGVSPYTESQARDESLIFGWFAPEDLQQLDVRPAAVVERLFP